jgi:hypothetical protein
MELRVHLKICEACGCLWYRAQFEARVYCSTCFDRFREFPAVQGKKRRGRPRKVVLATVFAVASETRDFERGWQLPTAGGLPDYAVVAQGGSCSRSCETTCGSSAGVL